MFILHSFTENIFEIKLAEKLNILLLSLSAIVLISLQIHMLGWIILGAGFVTLIFCAKDFSKDLALLYICIAIIAMTPISTSISILNLVKTAALLFLPIAIPFTISRFIYKDSSARFRVHRERKWYKTEILYNIASIVGMYFIFPFYLRSTGAYHNWTVEGGASGFFRLLFACVLLGLWDELFFISTTLGILRKHLPFYLANIVQAILFTSFLYVLGFRGWGFIMVYAFALSQGYIFMKSGSLFYVISIHLSIDLILYLALIHAYHPSWVPIFLP